MDTFGLAKVAQETVLFFKNSSGPIPDDLRVILEATLWFIRGVIASEYVRHTEGIGSDSDLRSLRIRCDLMLACGGDKFLMQKFIDNEVNSSPIEGKQNG
jgi:hypothetical protein